MTIPSHDQTVDRSATLVAGGSASSLGNAAAEVNSTVSAMAGAAGEQLAGAAGQAQHVAQEQLDRLAETIRRRPIQATGIAAGIGFVLALLARR
jgi:ElaB/YqjD/DUF883 family membrane-anchored ribosome-binding protein